MSRQDIEKLLGGYATGTLTREEEQALFAAALEDQQLFDTLVHEQPLHDLLQDPAARAHLLSAFTEQRVPWYRRYARPLVAAAALICVAVPLAVWQLRHPKPQPVLTAEVAGPVKPAEAPASLPAAAPPPEPPPARVRARASAKPAARQAEAKPELPAAHPAGTTNTLTLAEAAPAAVAPGAKDVMVKSNEAGVAGGVTAQTGKTVPAVSSNGFLPAQTPPNTIASLDAATRRIASKAALARIRWTVLRRQSDGEFITADPANLQAGDTVKLRLESDDTGFVEVVEGLKRFSSAINPAKPFETTLEPQAAGTREVEFWFTRGPVFSQVSAGAQPANAPRPPSTRITLTYK